MKDPLDAPTAIAFFLTFVTSREVAEILGPYAAIIVAATASAGLSLSRNDTVTTLWRGMVYVGLRVLLASVLTVTAAKGIKAALDLDLVFTMIPLAIVIAWVRDYDRAFVRAVALWRDFRGARGR